MSALLASDASLEGDEHGPGLHPQLSQGLTLWNWFSIEGEVRSVPQLRLHLIDQRVSGVCDP